MNTSERTGQLTPNSYSALLRIDENFFDAKNFVYFKYTINFTQEEVIPVSKPIIKPIVVEEIEPNKKTLSKIFFLF